MRDYRVYLLDDAGRIRTRRDVACADDNEAWTSAETLLDGCDGVELWEGARRLGARSPGPRRNDCRIDKTPGIGG